MCKSPTFVWIERGPEYVKIPVPCDRCWSCRENYVSDWVGRCLCEAATSVACCTIALTYSDPPAGEIYHKVIQPLHFQHFMKRLRNAGHKVRYLVAGEYGESRARAHFHVILFFKHLNPTGAPPPFLLNRKEFKRDPAKAYPFSQEIPNSEMVHINEWPHGHVVLDWSMSEKAVRYCCEYLYKDGKRTAWMSMSKKPPLGFEWFAEKAALNRTYDVLPSSFEYLPPGGRPGKKYLMTGATRRDYLNMITTSYGKRPRMARWVQETFDKLRREERHAVEPEPLKPLPPKGAPLTEAGLLALGKKHGRIADAAFRREGLASMLDQGFDDEEEYEAFREAGGYEANPDLRNAVRHRSRNVPGRPCDPRSDPDQKGVGLPAGGSAAGGKVEPRWRDREGKPLYRDPKAYRQDWPFESPSQGRTLDPDEEL